MKTKQQIINRVLLSIPPLRKKIVQRLKDNEKLTTNAAVSCYEKNDWYNFERYSSESIRYRRLISKIESKYKFCQYMKAKYYKLYALKFLK